VRSQLTAPVKLAVNNPVVPLHWASVQWHFADGTRRNPHTWRQSDETRTQRLQQSDGTLKQKSIGWRHRRVCLGRPWTRVTERKKRSHRAKR